jgi:hypothetical protein
MVRLPRGDCDRFAERSARELDDGRIAYLWQCYSRGQLEMRAYAPTTGRSALLRPYNLPFGTRYFDFPADPRHPGLLNDGNGLYEHLRWLYPQHLSTPLRLPFARVGDLAWSANGKQVAIIAARESSAVDEADRLYLPFGIYLASDELKQLKLLLGDLYDVGGIAWAPAGDALAVVMRPRHKKAGLWLVTMNGKSELLLEGKQFGGPTWLPDGKTIIVSTGTYADSPDAQRDYGREKPGVDVIQLHRR